MSCFWDIYDMGENIIKEHILWLISQPMQYTWKLHGNTSYVSQKIVFIVHCICNMEQPLSWVGGYKIASIFSNICYQDQINGNSIHWQFSFFWNERKIFTYDRLFLSSNIRFDCTQCIRVWMVFFHIDEKDIDPLLNWLMHHMRENIQ
jgi:hypothetical protein